MNHQFRAFFCAVFTGASICLSSFCASAAEQGIYEIASHIDPDFVLDNRFCTVTGEDTGTLQLYRSLDVSQQKFYLEELPSGDIFLSNGSHGCINLPTWAAEVIYENTYIGYPVVCYN